MLSLRGLALKALARSQTRRVVAYSGFYTGAHPKHGVSSLEAKEKNLRPVQTLQQRRSFLKWVAAKRLGALEAAADAAPADARAQAAFLRRLGEYNPEAVAQRVEAGRHAVDEEVARAYLGALVHCGRLDRAALPALLDQLRRGQGGGLGLGLGPGGVPGAAAGGQGSAAVAGLAPNAAAAAEAAGVAAAARTGGLYVGKKTIAVPASVQNALAGAGAGGSLFGLGSASSVAGSGGFNFGGGAAAAGAATAGPGGIGGGGGAALPGGPAAAAAAALWGGGGGGGGGPLHVVVAEAGWRAQAWRTARTFALAFLVASAVGAALDSPQGGLASRLLGNSKVASNVVETSDKRFKDVCGVDEAKAELEEIVMFLKDPKRFTRLGGGLPKGVMLVGPPGTGKTLLARAVAGEAGVPFFYCSGSEFEEMYVGVGARRVRDLFDAAKKRSPCIIFIDEIDAIGGSRHLKEQQAMKMTLNQLLVEMDGFQQNSGVIVVAATNFPDVLDNALTRPGRFDKHVQVPLPDVGGRRAILDHYATTVSLDPKVDLSVLARGTPGMSGAELYNLVNQAALRASSEGKDLIDQSDLDFAKDKILMGAERKSAYISKETARMTAYHEGGHALVAALTPGADPVHKATIMPRGRALGMVQQLPEGDQTSRRRGQMVADLDVCMGGRVAEELVYGEDEVTSGASSDLQQATRLAKAMVMYYGMSDEVGPVFYDNRDKISPETKAKIDLEIKNMLDESYARATKLLTENRSTLNKLANALIEHETLTGVEIQDLIAGKRLRRKKQ